MLSTGSSVNGSVRHQQHVGGLDALPAGDRRAVERVAFLELVLAEVLDRYGDVLLLAAGVGEPEVDELHLLVLDQLQYVIGRHRHRCGLLGRFRVRCGLSSRLDVSAHSMPNAAADSWGILLIHGALNRGIGAPDAQ
jgi:hypothetical protein